MSNFFIKDNRIRFSNLALFMVLLSFLMALVAFNYENQSDVLSHHKWTLLVISQGLLVVTWGVILSIETLDLIKKWIQPIRYVFQMTEKHSTKQPLHICIQVNPLSSQHQHMVMRC